MKLPAPWSRIPLVHDTTNLLPADVMAAITGAVPVPTTPAAVGAEPAGLSANTLTSLASTYVTPAQQTTAISTAVSGAVLRASKMVLFGDSYASYNYGTEIGSRPSPGSRGFAAQANVFLGHRLTIINKGVGGEDTIALLARAATDLVAVSAGWAHINSGTNDITNGRTYNQITQNLAALYALAEGSGKRVIGMTIPPRTSATTAQKLLRAQVNQWILGQGATRPGFIVNDLAAAVTDPLTYDFVAGYSWDGVHLATPGAIAAGVELANKLRPFIPEALPLFSAADPLNLLPSNGGGFPGTGTAITPWNSAGWSQGPPTFSKVQRTDGVPGQWQQIVVPTDSRGFLRSTSILLSGGTYAVGDTVRASVEFQAENLEVGVTANTQAIYMTLEYFDGTTTFSRYDLEYSALANENSVAGTQNENQGNRARSGVMLTAPLTIPAGGASQNLSMTVQARGGGTYRFARASIFKV